PLCSFGLRSNGRPRRLRNLRDCLRYLLRLVLQRQVSLSDDSNHAIVAIHNRDAPDLVLLHGSLTLLDVFSITARDRLMNFWMGVIFGSRPSATIEEQRSRSVITPTSSLDC